MRIKFFKVNRSWIGYFFIAPAMIYLFIVTIYPLFYTLQISFTDVDAGRWHFVGFNHYIALLKDRWFWNSLRAITIFTIGSTILHLFIGLIFAVLLNEHWFSNVLRNITRGLLILPWLFSTAASALMWSLLFHPFGLLNFLAQDIFGLAKPLVFFETPSIAMSSLIIVNTWKSYPFYMITILGGLQSIPVEHYEAAKIDGANGWQRFTRITLPQLRPILIAASTIDIITTFGHIDLIKMLTKGGPFRTTETTAYYLFKTALLDGNLGYGSAIGSLMLIILIVFTMVYLRIVSRGGQYENF